MCWARAGGIEVRVVDAGVDADLSDRDELIHAKVMRGTANFAVGPAMKRARQPNVSSDRYRISTSRCQ